MSSLLAAAVRDVPLSRGATVQVSISLLLVLVIWRLWSRPHPRPTLRSVAILVLGDIGRSPRMMYHAESFATNGFQTYLIGQSGSNPIPSLLSIPLVQFFYLSTPPRYLNRLPFIYAGPRKVLQQIIDILSMLLFRIPHPPEFILVQNPPSIPTLALVWLVAKLRGSKVIIDWHNLGYSILALKLGERHMFVRIAKWFESYFGRSAYAHLFVTEAMREHLVKEWHLSGQKVVLHDRPPARFHRASASETHELFLRLQPLLTASSPSIPKFLPPSETPASTPFTRQSTVTNELSMFSPDISLPALRDDRTALVVSSTSWTPDEDFGMLLEALRRYETLAKESEGQTDRLPKILVIVTGKGPLKEKYISEVERLQSGEGREDGGWKYVRCISLWLEAEDYPLLLGSADVGVSLHSSSSNLDLPMKVVDMFGCGLPVCALGFDCLDELVKDGVNGLVFHNAEQLANQLASLLRGFPSPPALANLQASFKHGVKRAVRGHSDWEWGTWPENWDKIMRPLLLHDVASEAAL